MKNGIYNPSKANWIIICLLIVSIVQKSYSTEVDFGASPNPPSELTATAICNSIINLEWVDNSDNETGFRVERSLSQESGFEPFAILPPNVTFMADNGLLADTTYFYRILAINEDGESEFTEITSATTNSDPFELPYYWTNSDIGSPRVPGTATFENGFFQLVGNGFMNENLNNGHYMYQTLNGDGEIIGQVTQMTSAHGAHHGVVIRETLEPGANYVMAEYSKGRTPVFRGRDTGEYFYHENDDLDFSAPFWLRMQRIGNEFIGSISKNGQDWQEIQREVVPMDTDVLIGLLTHADRNDKTGSVTWRDVEAAQSFIGAPSELIVTPTASDEIVLAWQDNANNESGFRVERSIKGEDVWKDLVEVGPNVTSFIDDGLIPGGTYSYRVRATAGNAASFSSSEETAEVVRIPNTVFFMERKMGDFDRTNNDNIISVTKTADTIKNVLRHPGMIGKQIDVTLETPISSSNGAISFKIIPKSYQQTIEIFSSDLVKITQAGGKLQIDANNTQTTYDVELDTVTCNHIVLNLKNQILTPYINGQFFDGVPVGSDEMGSFSLKEFNGNVWDVLVTDKELSLESINDQSDRCVTGIQITESPFADRPFSICAVYNCVWEQNESDLLNDRKLARLQVQEITFDRNTFGVGMYVQPDLDEWLKRDRDIRGGFFEYFGLNGLFATNQNNTSYLIHENFHSYQVPLGKGGKWLAEGTADWAIWNFYKEPLRGYATWAFTLNPHFGILERIPPGNGFYFEVQRFYHTSVFLAYVTTYLSDESIIGKTYNAPDVQANAFLALINLLEQEGVDFDQEFAEFAARTTVWDYPDPEISEAFKTNQRKGLINGFPDYRFIDVMNETGTYGIYQPVSQEFLPGAYGWNAFKIDSTASSTYTIKLKGSDQNPEYLNFIGKVVKGKPGSYDYLDFPVNQEVTLGEGEAVLEINTDAGDELYLILTAASRENMRNREIPHIYEYAIESSEHLLPNDHFKTFVLNEEIRRAEIDHNQNTISAKVVRGTDIRKLTPIFTLSDGATSSPASEEEVDFTIPVTYLVSGEGNAEAKVWTVSVSSEAERSGTDIQTFELRDLVRFAAIDETAHTVIANLESEVDLTSVVPIFTLSEGATCQPASGEAIDLTSPVTFTVTAEDGITIQEWTISAAEFRPFITSWETTTNNEEIAIDFGNGVRDFIYTWKDASGTVIISDQVQTEEGGTFSATLPSIGVYTLEIVGEYAHFAGYPADKLKDVLQWGDIHWRDMSRSFRSWKGERFSATDLPNLRNVTSMFRTFERATNFNGDISEWDVRNVSNMSFMFRETGSFNGEIGKWDVSGLVDASEMFRQARDFNADISKWNTSNLREMTRMFFAATSFDQSLGDWDIRNVTTMSQALNGGLSTRNYDRTLIGWASQNVKEEVILETGASFCAGEDARTQLISEFNWNISDGGLDCPEGGEAHILSFELDEEISAAVIDDENNTIAISVPGGSNITALQPDMILSVGATSTPSVDASVDFSQPVVYSVVSEDGNTQQDWTVTVTEALNTATDFVSFTFAEASGPVFINLDNHAIVVIVEERTNLTNLTPLFDLSSGAESNLPSGEARDFAESIEVPVIYTITAEDGVTKQNWKVIVSTRENDGLLNAERWINLQVYPNPLTKYLQVKGPGEIQAYVSSLEGKRLTPTKSGEQIVFDLDHLSGGIYLLVARYQNQVTTQRIIKEG